MNRTQRRQAARFARRAPPRRLDPTAWEVPIVKSRETDPGVALDVALKLRTAFDNMRSGQGTEDDYVALACALNVGLTRAEQIAPSLEATMLDGQRALLDCAELHDRHGRFGFTGPGLLAMDAALDAYEAIVSASTPHQMEEAMSAVLTRMRNGDYIEVGLAADARTHPNHAQPEARP